MDIYSRRIIGWPLRKRLTKELVIAALDMTVKQRDLSPDWFNPKGNADTERVIRTLKEYLIWPYDWDHLFDFQRALEKWRKEKYSQNFPHQVLGYRTPL
jgi:transposase InsO family protein